MKKVFFSLGILLFAGLMFFNVQQASVSSNADSAMTLVDLEVTPVTAEAEADCQDVNYKPHVWFSGRCQYQPNARCGFGC